MSPAVMLTSRRYSAVIIKHVALGGQQSARLKQWGALTGDRIGSVKAVGDWLVAPVEHFTRANYYSQAAASPDDLSTSTGFVQGLYIASPPLTVFEAEPCLLVAAPYVRLLDRTLRDFEKQVGQPRPGYVRPLMTEAFDSLADPPAPWVRVSRFSVVNRNEPSVDRISIAGRNPLRAAIGKEFAADGVAYDLRLESKAHDAFKSNLNLDRHGNFWWYHRDNGSFSNVLPVLSLLQTLSLFSSTRMLPTSRKAEEDD